MAAANDLRKGKAIKYNGNTAIVLEVHHRTPGNLRAFVQAIIRYINTGKSADVRFGSTDKVELVDIERTTARIQLQGPQRLPFHGPGDLRHGHAAGKSARRREGLSGGKSAACRSFTPRAKRSRWSCPSSVKLKVVEVARRSARRYRQQRDQAGQARDRQDDQRPALHQGRRDDQDRYPHRRLHGSRLTGQSWRQRRSRLTWSAPAETSAAQRYKSLRSISYAGRRGEGDRRSSCRPAQIAARIRARSWCRRGGSSSSSRFFCFRSARFSPRPSSPSSRARRSRNGSGRGKNSGSFRWARSCG